MWPNFGEISSSSHKDIQFTWFLGHCLLWPWPLTQNSIKNGRNSLHWFLRYSVHKVFQSLPALTLTFWPKNLISTSVNPNTSVTKTGWNSFYCFLRYDQHFQDAQTHSRMDTLKTKCLRHWRQNASDTEDKMPQTLKTECLRHWRLLVVEAINNSH